MNGKSQICTHAGCTNKSVARRLCRAHYQAAWKAGELGAHAKQPSRVINRTVCPPDHKHGRTGTCYVHHQCRCTDCSESTTRRNYRRLQLKAYGRYDTGLVDVAPVREHVLMLGEFGIGYKRVARMCGFRSSTPVRTIIWGRQDPGPRYGEMQKRVKRETAIKIMRIRPTVDHLGATVPVPARGAHRRVQALVSRGWSMAKIAQRIEMYPGNFTGMMQRDQIQADTFRKIRDLYEELWNQSPPETTHRDKIAASRARKHAKNNLWASPLAWDDIDTDQAPDYGTPPEEFIPDEQAIELAVMGVPMKLHPVERRLAIKRLHAQRLSDSTIADRLGITDRTVLRVRGELHLQAWSILQQEAGVTDPPRTGRKAA